MSQRLLPLIALMAWLLTPLQVCAEQIASYQGLTASVPDGAACGSSVRVTINAPDSSAYSGDRIPLQNLIGGIRANFADCPGLKSFDLTGLVDSHSVFRTTITAQNGWKLPTGTGRIVAENLVPGLEAKSAHCDYNPRDPLVGCWASYLPIKQAGLITNIRRDHNWFFGTPSQLASGTMTAFGPDIQRAYMFGTGMMADVLDWDGHRHRVPGAGPYMAFQPHAGGLAQVQGPYFQDGCTVMLLAPYAPFGLNVSGDVQALKRLRPLTITADIFSNHPDLEHIRESLLEDVRFENCPENADHIGFDQFLSPTLLLEAPIFAKLAKVSLRRLFLSTTVAREFEALGAARALAARDSLAESLAPLRGKAPATVTAGYNIETGEVVAKACGGLKCAEDHVVEALGGDSSKIRFTSAVRPRTGQEVPVCPRCETSYGRGSFPPGTRFKTDQ